MNTLKRLLLLFLVLCCDVEAHAQMDSLQPVFMSADVANLGKYGTFNIGYYSGTPNISIPLHDISDNGLDIPLALSYDASGFIPNKNAGIVGLNWNMVAGGAITRQVHGSMDDLNNPNPDLNQQLTHTNIGFIYGQQHNLGTYSKELVRQVSYVVNLQGTGYPQYTVAYDYEPDVFSFNFLGHTGTFFMGNDGRVQVNGDRDYKVDLSGFKGQYDFAVDHFSLSDALIATHLVSQITLTSDDGYKFYFGGKLNSLEISFSCDGQGRPVQTGGCINAWYLTKVVSPEGVETLFNYLDYTSQDLLVFKSLFNMDLDNGMRTPANFLEPKFYWNQAISGVKRGSQTGVTNSGNLLYMSLIKTAYLSQIKTATQTVDFNYSQKDQTVPFYKPTMQLGAGGNPLSTVIKNRYTQRLDRIEVKNGLSVRQIIFNYTYFGSRMFLNQVSIADKVYKFGYEKTANLPDPLTKGIDVWGFYNGKDANTDLVMPPNGNTTNMEVIWNTPGADRAPDSSYVDYGLLHTITYPTGGTTTFVFEPNTYSKVLKRTVSSGIQPIWEMQNGIGAGIRIKQITNYPGNTTTYFKYIKDYDQNPSSTVSSGMLSVSGIYYLNYTSTTETQQLVSSNDIAAASTYSEPPLSYSEVIQINSPGYTQFKYTTHETNPDTYSLGADSYKITSEYSTNNFNGQMLRLFHYSSREGERGKLLNQIVFNSQQQKVASTAYMYNTNANRDTASVYGIHFGGGTRNWANYNLGLCQSYALYSYQNEPTKIVETTYNPTGTNQLTQSTTYGYKSNTRHQVTQMSSTDSKGDMLLHIYTYPEDYADQEPYTSMVQVKNILRPIIATQSYKNSIAHFLSSTTTHYSFYNNQSIIKPSSIETKTLGFPAKTRQLFTRYDQWGNLLESQTPGGIKNVYLWGYEHTYPVAKIVGSDYTIVASVISSSFIDSITATRNTDYIDTVSLDQNLQAYLMHLRMDIRTSGASVVTYTYQPIDGLGSMGRTDGQKEFYEYDGSGRLQTITDHEGKRLKAYDYHYKN